jgi:hypothetical protein
MTSSTTTLLDAAVLGLMTLILLLYIRNQFAEMVRLTSRIDDRSYKVRKLVDAQAAADYLARINVKLQALISHMMAKHPSNDDVIRLYQNYRPDSLEEGSPESGYTSFSVNKGERIVMCIRQKGSNAFVDENVLMYVAVHELAHLMTKEIGHTDTFWNNFRFLLTEAMGQKLYTKVEFEKKPEEYCGIHITSSIV